MTASHWTLFQTPLGPCGLAWSSRGICALTLPDASEESTRQELQTRTGQELPSSPPADIQHIISRIQNLLQGAPEDLSDVPLDYAAAPPFHQRVYDFTRALPPGKTQTYGEVAQALGSPGAARAVGQALGRNPIALLIPCHRVLAAQQRLGGFSAHGGLNTKQRLLQIEGASFRA